MIHPTAIVHPAARLGRNVRIGPYAVIDEHVVIGDDCDIGAHVVITGHTHIGRGNRIYPHASLGQPPQDKKYRGEPTRLTIGEGNTIREFCTLNTGTVQDRGETVIGNDNWIMAYVHIAHDCVVGDHTIFANNATLAGHVVVGDYAILGGFTGVHQFCRIGAHAFTGIASVIRQDVPPYVMVAGHPAVPHGINSEGLKRRGFSAQAIRAIRQAYKTLYRMGLGLEEARARIEALAGEYPELKALVEFLAVSGRGIIR
ncbi:MAG: acyl-ACP--UDP-N-acetylglucosamine O-acyltransferase [Thiobacillaceae bacterium]|nr:acyl-ACP--UDP-N-acetylglucosamine O-acyltransferase [Thiobacillaceae bacterium]MCX7673977.1 acyl-ACP--UDP-N-acetylglucosamine O-acyltransferase [Thiobacillaceae bacterium]